MKSTVPFEEIKELVEMEGIGREYMSHEESFGAVFVQLAEVKEQLAEIEKFLDLCLKQIQVNNKDLIKAKFSAIEWHSQLLATEAVKLAGVALRAKESY